MTAENNLTVEQWCEDNDYEYWSEGWNESEMLEFAEAYHKAKVESVSQKQIVDASLEVSSQAKKADEEISRKHYLLGFLDGARWAKSQLLK